MRGWGLKSLQNKMSIKDDSVNILPNSILQFLFMKTIHTHVDICGICKHLQSHPSLHFLHSNLICLDEEKKNLTSLYIVGTELHN